MRRAGAALLAVSLAACAKTAPEERGFPKVGVYEDHLALAKDPGAAVTSVERSARPTVVYTVTLNGAPEGRELPMTCAWIDPSGRVAHENSWKTKRVSTAVWPTHCRLAFGDASPPGTWKVEMSVDGRLLRTASFEVK